MSVESDLFDTISGLVSGRAYPNTLPQTEGLPVYPAIRYINIGTEIDPDICGDGNADNVRFQLDIIDNTYSGALMIRDLVRTAMMAHTAPAVLEDSASDFDADTKAHRIRMDYVIYLSSPA
jgi:hypothetical protein